MTSAAALKWWPPIGLLAMALLGLGVGDGSTGLDDWFIDVGDSHRYLRTLLLFTQPLLLQVMLSLAAVAAAYRRRWRLVAVVVLTPLVAVMAVRLLKRLFGREREGALAYPSGHVTVMTVVLGMVVLVAGARGWMLVAAATFESLGLVGQSFAYHYFTDTVGAVLLGTALVCLAVHAAGRDRGRPRCDRRHRGG